MTMRKVTEERDEGDAARVAIKWDRDQAVKDHRSSAWIGDRIDLNSVTVIIARTCRGSY
jgi:hypothetical protein